MDLCRCYCKLWRWGNKVWVVSPSSQFTLFAPFCPSIMCDSTFACFKKEGRPRLCLLLPHTFSSPRPVLFNLPLFTQTDVLDTTDAKQKLPQHLQSQRHAPHTVMHYHRITSANRRPWSNNTHTEPENEEKKSDRETKPECVVKPSLCAPAGW